MVAGAVSLALFRVTIMNERQCHTCVHWKWLLETDPFAPPLVGRCMWISADSPWWLITKFVHTHHDDGRNCKAWQRKVVAPDVSAAAGVEYG